MRTREHRHGDGVDRCNHHRHRESEIDHQRPGMMAGLLLAFEKVHGEKSLQVVSKFNFEHSRRHEAKEQNSEWVRKQPKAAEDSRTPKRCRDRTHAAPSARFWSAAVLCRLTSVRWQA